MARRRRKPRPRSIHGDGEGWNWIFPWPRPRLPPPARTRSSGLDKAITKIVTFFRINGKRRTFTERRRGRKPISRVHPHRYRRGAGRG